MHGRRGPVSAELSSLQSASAAPPAAQMPAAVVLACLYLSAKCVRDMYCALSIYEYEHAEAEDRSQEHHAMRGEARRQQLSTLVGAAVHAGVYSYVRAGAQGGGPGGDSAP